MTYEDFLKNKIAIAKLEGFEVTLRDLPAVLKPHQADIVRWACKGGSRAIFAQFGLGKTLIQLAIMQQVVKHEAKKREKEEAERKAKEIADGVFHVPHALYKKIQLKNRRLVLLPLEYRPFNARKGKVLTIVSDNGNVAKRLIRRAKTIRQNTQK